MRSAEILCLGNELLIGRTINTNAHFLGKRLTQLGYKVVRVTTIRDELDIAVDALKDILGRKPEVICITGGLGPTFDDIQLQIVAKATGMDLVINQEAYAFISQKYKELNPARKKMAMFPKDSEFIENPVGSAPSVCTYFNNSYMFSLPGIPKEMTAIFENGVVSILESVHGMQSRLVEWGLDVRGVRESEISQLIDKVRLEYPSVEFKSHPREDDQGKFLSLHTYAITSEPDQVKEALERWIDILEDNYTMKKSPISPVINDNDA